MPTSLVAIELHGMQHNRLCQWPQHVNNLAWTAAWHYANSDLSMTKCIHISIQHCACRKKNNVLYDME